MFEKQSQSVAEGALAIQAHGNVHVGLTYEAARQLALDVYQSNFPRLVSEAASLARARAEELTDKFLTQLHTENPGGLAQATQPDFQNALLNAQRDHACAGSAELADLLVDLLVDRTKQAKRDLIQLVLDEALKTAPKLTEDQLVVLGVCFLLRHVRCTANTWEAVVDWAHKLIAPVVSDAKVTPSTLSHLEFTGCGTVNHLVHADLVNIFTETYAAFFQTGFTQAQLDAQALPSAAKQYVLPHKGSSDRFEVAFINAQLIDEYQANGKLEAEGATKLKTLLSSHRQNPTEIKERILKDLPFMRRSFEMWEKDKLSQFNLTSVGMAIGHAFVKKTIKMEFAPLSIWIK